MQALRLNEVLMRVVAWHNRHPLARRIYPTQVHSIGEVLLPFASSMAAPAAGLSALGLPTLDDLLAPPQAAALAGFGANTDADTDADKPTPEAPTERRDAESPALADTSAPDPADAEASPFTLAEADLAALTAEAAQPTPAESEPQDPAPHADLSLPLDPPDAPNPAAQPAATPESPAVAAAQAQPSTSAFAAALAARSASLPASPPVAAVGRLLQRLLARLPGRGPALPRLQAVFSRDFIWPLSPRRVARWARRHGQLQPLAPPDWPRRVVEADSAMLAAARQKGLGQSVALHLLTAAVGVGDRRLRLLMAADGHIIGPRAYSPPRLAAAGTLLALALLGAGWTWLRPPVDNAATALATAGAAAAESSAAAASAASAAAQAALAASAASAVLVGASAVEPAASATVLDPAPAATAPAATPTPAAQAAAPSPAGVGAPAPLGRIRPTLSDEDKQAARAQTAALRSGNPTVTAPTLPTAPTGSTAAAAPAKVYALVSPPNPQRESANNVLAAMRRASGRLTPPVPEYTELMQDQGNWRAAWWPFVSLADAERARVMLASKGIKVEVVEF